MRRTCRGCGEASVVCNIFESPIRSFVQTSCFTFSIITVEKENGNIIVSSHLITIGINIMIFFSLFHLYYFHFSSIYS